MPLAKRLSALGSHIEPELDHISHETNIMASEIAAAARTCNDLQGHGRLGASLLAEPK